MQRKSPKAHIEVAQDKQTHNQRRLLSGACDTGWVLFSEDELATGTKGVLDGNEKCGPHTEDEFVSLDLKSQKNFGGNLFIFEMY